MLHGIETGRVDLHDRTQFFVEQRRQNLSFPFDGHTDTRREHHFRKRDQQAAVRAIVISED